MEAAIIILTVLCLALGGALIALVLKWNAGAAQAQTRRSELESAALLAQAELERLNTDITRERSEQRTIREAMDRETQRADEAEIKAAKLEVELDAHRKSEATHRADLEQRLKQAHAALQDAFKSTAADAVKASTEQLIKLADANFQKNQSAAHESITKLVTPITETLKRADTKISDIEKARTESYAALKEHLTHLQQNNQSLTDETKKLTAALRRPEVRGRYGEIQLERVAELAGMRDYCDFDTQSSKRDEEGNLQRPDMIVSLPNDRQIVIDAKTNIDAYLDAIEADDMDEQERHLERFAKHVLEQAKALSKKSYWSNYEGSPDFTVMFIPGDQFIDAALKRQPKLLDMVAEKNVLLASPSTLIGLLRAVHVGWREKNLSEQAAHLFDLGKELHERIATALDYTSKLGTNLKRSVDSYNKLIGSIDARIMPTIRKFEDAGASSSKQLPEPQMTDVQVKPMDSQTLLDLPD